MRGNMIQEQDNARHRAFSIWLRTGRILRVSNAGGIEFKFNPWHDPENGRFTFAGTGRYYGRGGENARDQVGLGHGKVEYADDPTKPPIRNMEEADAWRAAELAKHGHKSGYREAIEARYLLYKKAFTREAGPMPTPTSTPGIAIQATIAPSAPNSSRPSSPSSSSGAPSTSGGLTGGSGNTPIPPRRRAGPQQRPFNPGGSGRFAGGGATGSWEAPETAEGRNVGENPAGVAGSALGIAEVLQHDPGHRTRSENWRSVSRNGYLYEIDEQNRTRRISGEITLNPKQGRSLTAQRAAGGSDRRRTDHGGHYIARRFNGPTEAFNHFAQDAGFNRSSYRRLEEEWARAKRAGKSVSVKIVPVFRGASLRPSSLNVWFWIDGNPRSQNFPNEPKGAGNAK